MTQSEWTTRCRSAQGGDTGSRFVCTRRGIVVLLAMLGAASVAEAQVAGSLDELLQSGEQLQPGDEIFVTDVSGRRIRTRISDVSAIALSVTEGRNTRTLRDTDVRKIERRDSLVNGSLVGVGISIAALWGSCELGQSECYGEAYAFFPALGVGALVGGIVDELVTETILQKSGSARVAVSPMLAKKGLGARISLTWSRRNDEPAGSRVRKTFEQAAPSRSVLPTPVTVHDPGCESAWWDQCNDSDRCAGPTLDLHRQRGEQETGQGQLGEVGDVLQVGHTGRRTDLVDDEVGGLAAVHAGGVDTEQRRTAVLHQQARRRGADAGEVQVAGVSGRIVAKIRERIGPARRPPGPDQHRRALRDPAVRFLPRLHVPGGQQVVGIGVRRRAHVDDDAGQDEPLQRGCGRVGAALRTGLPA